MGHIDKMMYEKWMLGESMYCSICGRYDHCKKDKKLSCEDFTTIFNIGKERK